jgi:hypothetical protein
VREGDLSHPAKGKTLKMSYDEGAPKAVYSAAGVTSEAEAEDGGLDMACVVPVWGDAGLRTEPGQSGVPAAVAQPEQPVSTSLWGRHAIKQAAVGSAEARRDKVAAVLFGGKKTAAALAAAKKTPPPQSPPKTAVSPYAPTSGGLTEDDYQLIDEVSAEIAEQMPDKLAGFSQLGSPTPVYEAGPLKVAALAASGGVLLGLINEGDAPILGLKVNVSGPDVLVKETLSHPKVLRAIPAQQAVWVLSQFRFPQQAKGFPEFKFNATVQFTG